MTGQVDIPDAALSEAITDELMLEKKGHHDEFSDKDQTDESDGIHDGLDFPTPEELATLRRVSDKIPWSAFLIAIIEAAERFSYYGCQVVFTNFIQRSLPLGSTTGAGGNDVQSGALGMGQRASTGIGTFFQFWSYVTPLLGAYLADAHFGRFKTIAGALVVILIGHIILIVSAVPGVIEKVSARGAFVVAIIVMGLGSGLFKANISPLVAEQYRRTKPFVVTRRNGERVIVDPALTVARIYMYFYLFINIGALVGQISMTYAEKFVGFYLAYTLPTVVYLLCPFVLWAGRKRYITSPPTGSVLSTFFRLFRFASKGKWSLNPFRTYRNLSSPQFWEDAKPSNVVGEKPKWMTFDDVWVDEVARGIKACGVFCWYPLYWLTYNQINNNLISQAATMTTHNLPNDVLSNLDPFALIILIPICDQFIYPALWRVGIKFTALKKIAGGFFTGSFAMIWACVLQHYIYITHPCGYQASSCETQVSPINVWAQTGSYILIAISEIFASITALEYAFTKAPKNMRSLQMSIFLFTSAISSALGEAFVALAADPLLVWNYGSMAVAAFIGGCLFWLSVRKLDAREDELNNLPEGHLEKN